MTLLSLAAICCGLLPFFALAAPRAESWRTLSGSAQGAASGIVAGGIVIGLGTLGLRLLGDGYQTFGLGYALIFVGYVGARSVVLEIGERIGVRSAVTGRAPRQSAAADSHESRNVVRAFGATVQAAIRTALLASLLRPPPGHLVTIILEVVVGSALGFVGALMLPPSLLARIAGTLVNAVIAAALIFAGTRHLASALNEPAHVIAASEVALVICYLAVSGLLAWQRRGPFEI